MKVWTLLTIFIVISGGAYGWEQVYTGRTRLILSGNVPGGKTGIDRKMDDLANIATSSTVISRSTSTMRDIGIAIDPDRVLEGLNVDRIPGTSILQIEVTCADRDAAKAAADIIAAETRKFVREMASHSVEQQIIATDKSLGEVKSRIGQLAAKRKSLKPGESPAAIDAEIDGAKNSFADLTVKRNDERLKLRTDDLQVIDAAYVYPGRPSIRRTGRTGSGPSVGLPIVVVVGIVCLMIGAALGRSLSRRS